MRLDREGRRTMAQFLNGLAVATLSLGALAPMVAGTATVAASAVAFIIATALHATALALTQRR